MTLAEKLGSYDYYNHAIALYKLALKTPACLVYNQRGKVRIIPQNENKDTVLYSLSRDEINLYDPYISDTIYRNIVRVVVKLVNSLWAEHNGSTKILARQKSAGPQFGDKVVVSEKTKYYDEGLWGVINGHASTDDFPITFNPSAYRDLERCNSSGGPATFIYPKNAFVLRPTGRKEWVSFWRFKNDVCMAHNGYDYPLLVWTWEWNGQIRGE